ncbi:hypothetical protein GGP41_007003 [Bipolaris sorokiniana]|uniref:Rhodopsin domain-containing protein n=2 Tax=Cochliobolus sativus TaxID=45130 RepID=A0A8H5ZRY4_COCSA|nr:uncharacterized protein COCSADRAFT_351784 [Bipolaris sorokiniana ND90Pr]EMD67069.1 hypothetical protein COCSADRAFT_351784 [Bipolaris sorokiniana ND90Pr]KAF5854277.1 hypothetical protein GGP41_007003 [Bipolaris sorokiniana]
MLDPNAILTECRVEYAIGSAIILLRFFARWKIAGWRGFYWDDFFAFSSWVFFTMIYAMVEFLNVTGAPIAMTQEQREALPPATRKSMREGAKAMFASFYFLIFLVWSLKGCIIVLFLRFTRDTPLYQYVQMIGGVSIAACIAAIITQTTHCLPLKRNWQILPDPGKECSAGVVINIVIAVGNVLVDALLIVVPFWMLKDSHIRLWRKIRIVFLLSLGLFVMGMATARCILSIGTSVQVALASVWAQREAVVSIFAVNAPVINGLFRAEAWATRKYTSDYSSKYSRTYSNPLHKKKKSGFEIYKMTDFETKMSDMETARRESIVELVTDPSVASSASQWRCSVEAASQKGHPRRAL